MALVIHYSISNATLFHFCSRSRWCSPSSFCVCLSSFQPHSFRTQTLSWCKYIKQKTADFHFRSFLHSIFFFLFFLEYLYGTCSYFIRITKLNVSIELCNWNFLKSGHTHTFQKYWHFTNVLFTTVAAFYYLIITSTLALKPVVFVQHTQLNTCFFSLNQKFVGKSYEKNSNRTYFSMEWV